MPDLPPFTDADPTSGPADAAVTLVHYGDFECPYSKQVVDLVRDVRQSFPGRVRYGFRHFPVRYHLHALAAAVAAEAAAAQGAFWAYHDRLYAHQHALRPGDLADHADALRSEEATAAVLARKRAGVRVGVRSTLNLWLYGLPSMKNLALVATTLFALIAGCASPEEPVPSQQTPTPELPETEANMADAGHPAFADPERLCLVLRDEGLPPALTPTWKQVQGTNNYSCVADDLEVTPGNYSYVGDVPNVIEYYAESDVADRVDLFRLTANIFNEQRAAPVVTRFQELARTLFDRLDLTMPEGLAAAIEQGQSETFDMEYGTVTLTRESYNMGHGLVVSVEREDSPS